METLKQQVRKAITPRSGEEMRRDLKSAMKALGVTALVVALMIGIVWIAYDSGVSHGKISAEAGARVTNYQKWEIPVTATPGDKPTPTPAASASPTNNFPPPIAAPSPIVAGSVTKLVTLSKAPLVTITFGTDAVHVLVALNADQWREVLAKSGDTNLEKVGVACLNVSETCSSTYDFGPSDTPSSVGLSVETVKHLAQPYISQLTDQQVANTNWEVTVELFVP